MLVKNTPANARGTKDTNSILGSGRSPGAGNSNLLQYSRLKNYMDRGAWQATVYEVAKSRLQLSTHTMTVIAIFQHEGHSESTENNTFVIGRQN